MFTLSSVLSLSVLLARTVYAAPTPELDARDGVKAVSTATLAGFAPYTQFARAAYCPSNTLTNWKCGDACNALSGFQPTLVGGDGNAIQVYFVGYWPSKNTVVVAHQGTDPTQLVSVLTDGNALKDPLDSALFPGVPSGVQVHDGFRNEHALTAPQILAEVKKLMQAHSSKSVTLVGHSLGGALAELDALFLKLNLPAGTSITARTYGTPRVGNPAFASYFDSLGIDFLRINNEEDIVPIVPGRGLGFAHPSGETHILSPGNAVSCPGEDDATDSQCQIKTVPNIFSGSVLDHLGPYEGLYIGSIYC